MDRLGEAATGARKQGGTQGECSKDSPAGVPGLRPTAAAVARERSLSGRWAGRHSRAQQQCRGRDGLSEDQDEGGEEEEEEEEEEAGEAVVVVVVVVLSVFLAFPFLLSCFFFCLLLFQLTSRGDQIGQGKGTQSHIKKTRKLSGHSFGGKGSSLSKLSNRVVSVVQMHFITF